MFRRTKKKSSLANQNRNFRPRVESLESRLNLAGNVTALLAGPNLYLTGDNANNFIVIDGTGPGAFTVSGFGTSLGGVPDGTRNFTGIANIFLTMKDGNDVANVLSANLSGLLSFIGGNGNDQLVFGQGIGEDQSFGSISADLGAGDDLVQTAGEANFSVKYSFISNNGAGLNRIELNPAVTLKIGAISVLGGTGDDLVTLGDDTPETTTTLGSVVFTAGAGNNRLVMDSDITLNGSLVYSGLGGDDYFYPGLTSNDDFLHVLGSVTLSLGNGTNTVRWESHDTTIGGVLSVLTGTGADGVTVIPGTAFPSNFSALSVSINTGAGDDVVNFKSIDSATIRSSLILNTGAGLDQVTLFALLVNGATSVNLGDGDNVLFVDNSRFRGPVSLFTGTGTDSINLEFGVHDGIGTRFDGPVTVLLGSGNDTINLGFDAADFVTFASVVSVNGQAGNDTIFASGFDIFVFAPVLVSIVIV